MPAVQQPRLAEAPRQALRLESAFRALGRRQRAFTMSTFVSLPDIWKKGIEAESEGRFVAAILLREECLLNDYFDSYGWLVLADAYREMGHCTACAGALDAALEHAPESERWMITFVMPCWRQGNDSSLLRRSFFETAAQYEGAQLLRWPLTLRAANLLQMEHFENAERFLCLALTIEDGGDDLDEVLHNLGLALLGQRKFQAAREAPEKAQKHNPESKPTQLALKSLNGLTEAILLVEELRTRHS